MKKYKINNSYVSPEGPMAVANKSSMKFILSFVENCL